MSCFMVSDEHLAVIVEVARLLGIDGYRAGAVHEPCEPSSRAGAETLFAMLHAANTAAVAHRYRSPAPSPPPHRGPPPPIVGITLGGPAQLAQAIQWVRCYRYQACDGPHWVGSQAEAFTAAVAEALLERLLRSYPTRWTFDP